MKYGFTAINDSGDEVKGYVFADSVSAATTELRAEGLYPTDIRGGNTEDYNWKKHVATMLVFSSCFFVSLSPFPIIRDLMIKGEIQLGIIIMLSVATSILAAAIYFHKEPAWKTSLKLIGITTALIMLQFVAYGIHTVVSYFFGEPIQLNIFWGFGLIASGIFIIDGIRRICFSKWLN